MEEMWQQVAGFGIRIIRFYNDDDDDDDVNLIIHASIELLCMK